MTRGASMWFTSAVAAASLVVLSCAEPTSPTVDAQPGIRVNAPSMEVAPLARLISCPTDQSFSAEATIGLSGGTLSAGGTTIVIPAGAVALPTTFEVVLPASEHMEVSITAKGYAHYRFLLPVSVSMDYSRCPASEVDGVTLSAYYIEDLTKSLLELMVGTDDKAARTLTFVTDHLSGYAIAN